MKENLPPRKYAEQVLGKAATPEQLDELFGLHAAAHPIVKHGRVRTRRNHNVPTPCTTVVLLSSNPSFPGSRAAVIASGQAVCNPLDQWNRRLGLTIAFGRALKRLRAEIES